MIRHFIYIEIVNGTLKHSVTWIFSKKMVNHFSYIKKRLLDNLSQKAALISIIS